MAQNIRLNAARRYVGFTHRLRCNKGHFFTVVVDADAVLYFYEREHTQIAVQALFEGYRGYLQADASSVYHLLEHGPPTVDDNEDHITLVGCWTHYLKSRNIRPGPDCNSGEPP